MPVEAPEIIEVDDTRVACDGGGGALGHPRVYPGNGRRDLRRMPLLRPPLRAEGRARLPSLSALKKGDHLYLIDGSGYLFRAYHALPPLTRKSDGLPTGAVSRLLQHAVEAAGGHEGRRRAHPSGGDLRRRREDLPQRHLSRNTRPTARRRRKT